MKRLYNIFFALLCVIVLLSFLPWLYAIIFPSVSSEPFIVYSPVSDCFVVSDNRGDNMNIFTVDDKGEIMQTSLTKNDRDSLVPQMYYNQLSARSALPDTIAGKAIDLPILKMSQWVFNSLPRDINRTDPGVYPIMESRPKRVDLEDPVEAFTLDGDICFIDMATNSVNQDRSRRFSKVFAERGFTYPAKCTSANITAKKGYDEGYLLIDSDSKLYHMKMQAGQPYMTRIEMPLGVDAQHAFILENPDMRHIGLVAASDGALYAIERDGYKPIKLPVEDIDAEKQRITIMKNLFNWVIKITDNSSSRWIAIDSDDYSLLGEYKNVRKQTEAQQIAKWIFPFRIYFTDIDDCYAYPRIGDFSLPASLIWIVLILIIFYFTNLYPKNSKR